MACVRGVCGAEAAREFVCVHTCVSVCPITGAMVVLLRWSACDGQFQYGEKAGAEAGARRAVVQEVHQGYERAERPPHALLLLLLLRACPTAHCRLAARLHSSTPQKLTQVSFDICHWAFARVRGPISVRSPLGLDFCLIPLSHDGFEFTLRTGFENGLTAAVRA